MSQIVVREDMLDEGNSSTSMDDAEGLKAFNATGKRVLMSQDAVDKRFLKHFGTRVGLT